ncbi:hypothetical protein [Paenibacillus sp. NPDC093718]|uniref:hypothetical protein n=1 Tax=Paenibacillus sp. NPDC093718 TaxID=3390601 RepID=UPI003CFEECA0
MSIKFQVKRTIIRRVNGQITEGVSIVVVDTETKFFRVHPVTKFILDELPNSFNSQKSAAEEIKKFLNWVFVDNYHILGLSSMDEIKIEHGVQYLNYLKNKNVSQAKTTSRSTMKNADRYLTRFFYYLNKNNCLEEKLTPKFEYNAYGKQYHLSPFVGNGFSLPSKDENNMMTKLTAFPVDSLITHFIEVSRKVAPDITLGLYFQFFGGLRCGEVVNLTRSSLILKGLYGEHGVEVDIKDRSETLFLGTKDTAKNQVKQPRNQIVQRLPFVKEIIKYHLLSILGEKHSSHDALFVNSNGEPMTGAVYEKRFLKVKKRFLELLEGSPFYSTLTRTSWSTHIGRGVFTNLMAKLVSSPQELALLRGDKTLDAAMVYMSRQKIQAEVEDGLTKMWEKGVFSYRHEYL